MNWLFWMFIDSLMKGNPLLLVITIIRAVAMSLGLFKQGLASSNPAGSGLVVFVILLTLGIGDRMNESPRNKKRTGVEERPLPSRDDTGAQH